MTIQKFEAVLASIRAGEIQPGDYIERSYDDDDFYWEFGDDAIISFAAGPDGGVYFSEPYWGERVYVVENDLVFASLATEGDGDDWTKFLGFAKSSTELRQHVMDFILAFNHEWHFAIFRHYSPKRFEHWNYPPAEALDIFAWCSSTLNEDDLVALDAQLLKKSPLYSAMTKFFHVPDAAEWAKFKDHFIKTSMLDLFYDIYKNDESHK